MHPSGHGFRRRPIVAADFHPRSVSSTRVPCAGVACGIRTRVSTLKEWCPGPSRRTRLDWWCPRRRLLAALGLRPVAAQRPDRLRRSERTRGLPLTRRLLCLLSYEGDVDPLRLCPNASIPSDVVSRCTWPGQGSRTSRTANTMSRGNGVKGHTRSGADDESRTRGPDHP